MRAIAADSTQKTQTFHDHITELRDRLMWVGGSLLAATAIGYSFHDFIIGALMKPLDSRQTLIYTSPAGGFEFLIKISLFFGFLLAVPILIFHIVKFVQPVLLDKSRKYLIKLLASSVALVIAGSSFAYFVTLPAALHFLTQFSNGPIQALLSTNEYLSFVMVYIAGFALLFQIPLVLLLLNKVTPLPPAKLLKQGRFVVIGSFIAAAIITPTPDPINQIWMAGPMVLLYGVGIFLVWMVNRSRGSANVPFTEENPQKVVYYQSPRLNFHQPPQELPQMAQAPLKQPVASQPAMSVIKSAPRQTPVNLHGGVNTFQPYIKKAAPQQPMEEKVLSKAVSSEPVPQEIAPAASYHALDLFS